ncbi:MAG: hypothetical protein U5L04_03305 [Trueperaceae bacterium]|nr:hypothetical protein [Trueperaceae bacterium]
MQRVFYIAVGVVAVLLMSWLIYQRTFNPSPQQIEQEQEVRRALLGPYGQAEVREFCQQAFEDTVSAEARVPAEDSALRREPMRQSQRTRWVWQTPLTTQQGPIETEDDASEGEWVCIITDQGNARVEQITPAPQTSPDTTAPDATDPGATDPGATDPETAPPDTPETSD